MKKRNCMKTVLVMLSIMPFLASCGKGNGFDELSEAFEKPAKESHPGAFWCWLNGSMSRERITYDLENMKAKGIARAEIWDVAAIQNPRMIPGGKGFMNDESVELIKYAISECRRLDMKVGMVASSGWNAGGTWVRPDWASKALYHSEIRVKGPKRISMELPFPDVPKECPKNSSGKPGYYREVAVIAVPFNKDKVLDAEKQIDLKAKFKDGQLDWEVPAGEWTVIRFICSNTGQYLIVPTPGSKGLFIDFLDPEATERHLQYFMDRLGVTPENAAEKGLDYYEFDSMELAEGIPWTDRMPQVFRDLRGYSLEKYYPVLAGWKFKDQEDDGQQFMYDFRKTVSDRLIFSHYVTGTAFLKKYDAQLVSESGGPGPPIWYTCPVDALKALGSVSVPRGEFWVKNARNNIFLIKEIASAAHIYGKRFVDAESFTTWRRWLDSPFELKRHLDRAFSEGLNNVTFHTYASTHPKDGFPGRTYHAGLDINTGTTWWGKSAPFMDYITRCCEMLKKGLFVADVCYYYGDKAPNFFPAYQNVPQKPRLKELGHGYDFDVVNSDVILNRLSVKNGRFVLPDGMGYSLLVLQDSKEMRLEVLKKIAGFVDAGAKVAGPKPERIPGIHSQADEEEFGRLVSRLWDSGKIFSGKTADAVLQKQGIVPDFQFDGEHPLEYIHRSTGDCDIYFVNNETDFTTRGKVSFRVRGKNVEIWDPSTGGQFAVSDAMETGATTSFLMELPPHGSCFVVFAYGKRPLPSYTTEFSCSIQEISTPWSVRFDPKWGGPEEVEFRELESWTASDINGIRYYSGTAGYNNRIRLSEKSEGKRYYLDLGDVREVAEVYVNGKSAGILWKKPYRIDISALLHSGENELKIEVVNMWANRLTGDLQLPEEKRFCRTNQKWGAVPLLPSGLLGPVRLMIEK